MSLALNNWAQIKRVEIFFLFLQPASMAQSDAHLTGDQDGGVSISEMFFRRD